MHRTCRSLDSHNVSSSDKSGMCLRAAWARRPSGKGVSRLIMVYVVNSKKFAADREGAALLDILLGENSQLPLESINNPALAKSWCMASLISVNLAANIGWRAIMMTSQPGLMFGRIARTASRNIRLARFLCTDPPSDLPAITPKRDIRSEAGRTSSTTSGWA